MRKYIMIGLVFTILLLTGIYVVLGGSNEQTLLSLVDVTVESDESTDMVIGVQHPETMEAVGELRWETIKYRIVIRNDSSETLRHIQTKLVPSPAIRALFGNQDPFNDHTSGSRVNYGNLPELIEIAPGSELEIERMVVTHAKERESEFAASELESPLTTAEAEQFREIATQDVFLEVRWRGGSQTLPLDPVPSETDGS